MPTKSERRVLPQARYSGQTPVIRLFWIRVPSSLRIQCFLFAPSSGMVQARVVSQAGVILQLSFGGQERRSQTFLLDPECELIIHCGAELAIVDWNYGYPEPRARGTLAVEMQEQYQ